MTQSKVKLTDKNFLITKDGKVALTLTTILAGAVMNLKFPRYIDPIFNITENYNNHPSIVIIKNVFPSHSFVFDG